MDQAFRSFSNCVASCTSTRYEARRTFQNHGNIHMALCVKSLKCHLHVSCKVKPCTTSNYPNICVFLTRPTRPWIAWGANHPTQDHPPHPPSASASGSKDPRRNRAQCGCSTPRLRCQGLPGPGLDHMVLLRPRRVVGSTAEPERGEGSRW